MSDLAITGLLVLSLFLILGSGVWIGLTLSGVAWIAMQLFSARPAGDAMAVTIWGSASSWTLTALPGATGLEIQARFAGPVQEPAQPFNRPAMPS